MRKFVVTLLCATGAYAASTPLENLDVIITKMQQQHQHQAAALCGYTATRVYILHNTHLSHDAVMTFRVTRERASGKHFKLLSQQHAGFVVRRAMMDIVDAEPKTRRQEEQGQIDPANYNFALLGEESLGGERCYVLQLSPRRKSKYLVRGKAWIDIQSYAVRRIQGQLAESVSFWIGKPEIEENYGDIEGFWMPSYNSSVAHVKFVGTTTVTIKFSNYLFQRCGR